MQAASCWIGSFPEARRTLFRRFGLWAWMRSSKRPAARLGRFAACYSHACQGVKFVSEDLDFDRADSDVSVFELTIRALATQRTQNGADRSRHSAAVRLGGLLGAHTLSGKEAGIARLLSCLSRKWKPINASFSWSVRKSWAIDCCPPSRRIQGWVDGRWCKEKSSPMPHLADGQIKWCQDTFAHRQSCSWNQQSQHSAHYSVRGACNRLIKGHLRAQQRSCLQHGLPGWQCPGRISQPGSQDHCK